MLVNHTPASRENVAEGDLLVVCYCGSTMHNGVKPVTKVTRTHLMVDGKRYARATGYDSTGMFWVLPVAEAHAKAAAHKARKSPLWRGSKELREGHGTFC
jgi:hypothetical protein